MTNLFNYLENTLKAEVVKFDNNNAWGFGGAGGTRYKLKNMTITVGGACFRHLPKVLFIRVDHNGKHGVIDMKHSDEAFETVYKYVRENYK